MIVDESSVWTREIALVPLILMRNVKFQRCTKVSGLRITLYPFGVPRGGSVAHTKRWKRHRREKRRLNP